MVFPNSVGGRGANAVLFCDGNDVGNEPANHVVPGQGAALTLAPGEVSFGNVTRRTIGEPTTA